MILSVFLAGRLNALATAPATAPSDAFAGSEFDVVNGAVITVDGGESITGWPC